MSESFKRGRKIVSETLEKSLLDYAMKCIEEKKKLSTRMLRLKAKNLKD